MRIPLELIGSELTESSNLRDQYRASIEEKERALEQKRKVVKNGGGAKYVSRVHKKNKLTTFERLALLIDEGSDIYPVCTLVNWGRDFNAPLQKEKRTKAFSELKRLLSLEEQDDVVLGKIKTLLAEVEKHRTKLAPGAGVVTAFCRVQKRIAMVIANDNTVVSGAWWPRTPEKIQRAQDMALKLKIPVIYLVDCSGLFLPEQGLSFPGKTGAGHIFQRNALLSASGVPQLAGVFGDCIAGGGYMPIISDRVIMTEVAYMVIAGAALIKGAKAQQLTSLDIGGAEVHVHKSGCADIRVPDDPSCISLIKDEIAKLPSSAIDYYRYGTEAEPPLFSPNELSEIFPSDHRHIYDIQQVLSRLVDGSLVHTFLPHTGKEILTAVARVSGLWVGFACNVLEPQSHPETGQKRPGGILYREGIAKLATFSRACNDDGIPIFWLQDIAGFDIGVEAEAMGLLGYGSSLIYTNSTNTTPMFSVLLRKASGAGYYAMAGLPYEPVVQLATTFSRLAVMEGRTLAIASFRTSLDENFQIATENPEERAQLKRKMEQTAARIEKDMNPITAAAQLDTDEVIKLDELRDWLVLLSEAAYQSIGHRRIKNPRIWSIHDLNILSKPGVHASKKEHVKNEREIVQKEGHDAILASMDGSFWSRPAPTEKAFISVGQEVQLGQTLGLIEVMKTFSPIKAESLGIFVGWEKEDGASISTQDVLGWVKGIK